MNILHLSRKAFICNGSCWHDFQLPIIIPVQGTRASENLALRHQLEVLQRNAKRPRLTNRDRALWVILSRLWHDWQNPLALVQPETVISWHKRGFRLYWRWKS